MRCTSQASLSVLWIGVQLDSFTPSRGFDKAIRYLHIYLFFVSTVDGGDWKAIKLSRKGSRISHLCFADDLLLFGVANERQTSIMEKVLHHFCTFSAVKDKHGKVSTSVFIKCSTEGDDSLLDLVWNSNFQGVLCILRDAPFVSEGLEKIHILFLVEKFRKKLSAWKRTTRTLLVQTSS